MPHIHEKIDFVVSAYIVNQDRVLLVKHKALKVWLPIGGHIELEEDPEQALYREIKEECGLDVTILAEKPEFGNDRKSLIKALPRPDFLDRHTISDSHEHIGLTYIGVSESDSLVLAEKEHDEIRWFSTSDLKNEKYQLMPDVIYYANHALIKVKKKEESSTEPSS